MIETLHMLKEITRKHAPAVYRKIKDPLEGIDIDREYELIQQKQCRLSRRLRDLIVARKLHQQASQNGGKNEINSTSGS